MDVENLSIEIVQTLTKSSPFTLSIIQLIICEKKTVERLNLNSSEVLSAEDGWDPDGLFVLRSNDFCGCVRVSINFLREPHFWSCLRYRLAMDSGDCPRKNLVKSGQFRKVCRMGP